MPEITCSGTCTVVLQVEPTPTNMEHIEDMAFVWSAFLVAIILAFCLRKLLNIFDSAPHGE